MTTSVSLNLPTDDETKPIIQTQTEQQYLLSPPTKVLKPFPPSILQSIEANRQQNRSPISQSSSSNFFVVKQSSIDITDDDDDDDDLEENDHILINSSNLNRNPEQSKRSPSEIRITLYPNESGSTHGSLTNSQLEVSNSIYKNGHRKSDPSVLERKNSKLNRTEYLRRTLLDHRFGRRIHSSFSSSTTLRSLSRRRSTQNISPHPSLTVSRSRRHTYHLPRNSKWHIVRHRLPDIAMMSETYARMKLVEQDLRWINLREKIRTQVLDLREMQVLRQQDDGLISKKKTQKTRFHLKTIPVTEVIHVERDGQVYSMGTRDLVLGRSLYDEDIHLDTFAQLDARRQFQVQQHLLKQQEGRTRLKKYIAFSFCLCNLSFIVLMFASMFIFAMKTILEMRSREFPW
ncbi:unnamed protein product [Adineta steineri]|uniref:Uncharacterized protein n=1 Tax=Adineta steineri TaxID=433720 RepID=A0A815C3U1_9BILA|nr:unnamed protein product [Adineta steineri]CAF1246562.1 unnamed protein product [Adineta steineri]CAF1275372.1 unnamed protein product [Adineta steineri]